MDIVQRLRERAHQYDEYAWHCDIELEAANTIEELRAALVAEREAEDCAQCGGMPNAVVGRCICHG